MAILLQSAANLILFSGDYKETSINHLLVPVWRTGKTVTDFEMFFSRHVHVFYYTVITWIILLLHGITWRDNHKNILPGRSGFHPYPIHPLPNGGTDYDTLVFCCRHLWCFHPRCSNSKFLGFPKGYPRKGTGAGRAKGDKNVPLTVWAGAAKSPPSNYQVQFYHYVTNICLH